MRHMTFPGMHTSMNILKATMLMNIKLFLRYKFDIFYFIIMGTLSIAIWNATGIMSGASYAGDLLKRKKIHFLGISEHWLYRQN